MKTLKCDTPKGQYACKVDGYEKNSKEWRKEVNYAIKYDYEYIDWILNNSDDDFLV